MRVRRQGLAIRVAIVALVAFGAYLRLFNFWRPELWLDEYSTWWVVAGSWREVFERNPIAASTTPFYYLLVKGVVAVLGVSPFSLRLPSILCGVGILALAYPLGLRLFRDRDTALISLVPFAMNQLLIWYCQEARPYALGLLCVMASWLCYLMVLERDRWIARIGYGLATVGAYYTHYFFGFILVVQLLDLSLRQRWWRSPRWIGTFGGVALLMLISIGHLRGLFASREVLAYLPKQEWWTVLNVAKQLLDVDIVGWAAGAVLVTWIVWRSNRRARALPEARLLGMWFLLPLLCFGVFPPLIGATLLFAGNIHGVRFVLFTLPAALFIVGWLLASGGGQGWRQHLPIYIYAGVIAFLRFMPALITEGTYGTWPVERFASAARHVGSALEENDRVLFGPGCVQADWLPVQERPDPLLTSFIAWPLAAYLPDQAMQRVTLLPFRMNNKARAYLNAVAEQAAAHPRVWVIGRGPTVDYLIRRFSARARTRTVQDVSYGQVRVAVFDLASLRQ